MGGHQRRAVGGDVGETACGRSVESVRHEVRQACTVEQAGLEEVGRLHEEEKPQDSVGEVGGHHQGLRGTNPGVVSRLHPRGQPIPQEMEEFQHSRPCLSGVEWRG